MGVNEREGEVMVKQFLVMLMNSKGVITHLVNTNNAESAKYISETIYNGYQVIDVKENN